jgi:2-polyprenyl-6-methoxyphenol hydroxylase-like FAD-dependent oxidoreductase
VTRVVCQRTLEERNRVASQQTPDVISTSVLIAGAGPVGLALACELGLRGIDCLIVEKRDGRVHVPKMSLVSAGSMEFCRRWGIAKQVRTAVWSENHALDFVYMETLAGRELARIKIPSYAQKTPDWTPEGMAQCPQIYFDPILAGRVAQLKGVTFAYNTSLEEFTDTGEDVTATLADAVTGVTREVHARYLIGCDGASSVVRDALGIELAGIGAIANSVNIFFRAPLLTGMHTKGWARIYRPIDDEGCWSELIPIDGRELWRLTVFDDPRYEKDPMAALKRMAGFDVPCEIISTLLWERRDSVAESYGRGRVFLAGDSAHQSSPTGGAGMHTGMEEAVNLAWKLAAVLQGWGGPHLLASYEAERRPIAQRNIDLSTGTYRALRSIPPVAGIDRSTAWKTTNMPRYSIPDHVRSCPSFEASPIVVDDGSPALERAPAQHVASTRPGARAPHAWLADGRSTIDVFGEGYVLLRLGPDAPSGMALVAAAAARGLPMTTIHIADPAIAKVYEQPLVLVRPDFHIAWRGVDPGSQAAAIIDTVRGA